MRERLRPAAAARRKFVSIGGARGDPDAISPAVHFGIGGPSAQANQPPKCDIRMPLELRLARALVLSMTLHLGLLVALAVDGSPDAGPAERPGRLAAVLVPAATSQPKTARKAEEAPAPSAARSGPAAARAPALPRDDERSVVSVPAPLQQPDIAPWFDAAELDVLPKLASRPNLEYPPDAERDGIEGSVTLQLHIDEQGIVRQKRILASAPHGVFDRSALRAVDSLRFIPAEKDFRFVRSKVPYALEYRLESDRRR